MSNGMKAFFQKLARAFLIPVSLIGVASLIMAIGCIFTDAAIIKIVPLRRWARLSDISPCLSQ